MPNNCLYCSQEETTPDEARVDYEHLLLAGVNMKRCPSCGEIVAEDHYLYAEIEGETL